MPTYTPPPKPTGSPPSDVGDPVRIDVLYRARSEELPPRRIKLEIPGWAGANVDMANGAPAQPWHCRPYVDAASYGFELVYPYQTECRVSRSGDGSLEFHGDFTGEVERGPAERRTYPFDRFAHGHYGLATGVDLLPPPGHLLRIEPHPRFFTDTTGTVPAAVPGHLERFWPRRFFVVFKAPEPGQVHVFRTGEPFAQVLVVPSQATYVLSAMDAGQAADRAAQSRHIKGLAWLLARHMWTADDGRTFNDKYKQLLRIFRAGGIDGVREHLGKVAAIANATEALRQREP